MILKVHLDGARSYAVGDEIWHQPLPEVIEAEADVIASYARPNPRMPQDATRGALRDQIITAMTAALVHVGDEYRAPDGVLYSLLVESVAASRSCQDRLTQVSSPPVERTVAEVLGFEDVPIDRGGSRRAIVLWSDGSETIALTWYADEVLVCEGDLIGKTEAQIRSLHFRRDRDWLTS